MKFIKLLKSNIIKGSFIQKLLILGMQVFVFIFLYLLSFLLLVHVHIEISFENF